MATDPNSSGANGRAQTLSAARLALAVKRARTDAGEAAELLHTEPLAILGIGCRFPGGAVGPDAYWQLLEQGQSGIRTMPEDRWAGQRGNLAPHQLRGGYLEAVDCFDPEFFGIAPREAHSIDPQQRLLLEVCWEALADAGIRPSALAGTDTAAFVAIYNSDYLRLQLDEDAVMDAHTGVGAAHSVAAGRLSYLLNLRGPSLAIDTACSSSLVAAHLACESLRRRECGVALVGASSLKLLPDEVRAFAQWGMLAHDGQVKTFDAAADGFVPGEGAAMIVLKRLSDAIAHGDSIRAVIRGSAVNHGGRASVLTAPNGPQQEAVMRAALRNAQVAAAAVSFVETHGTGTSLGDPIEVEALDAVYGDQATADQGLQPCRLGAVKTNIGHLEATAGLAGLIKVVLCLEHQAIPRNLNFVALNPQIRLATESRLRIVREEVSWPRTAVARFAAVSSFGLSGTNAHLILEEAPSLPRLPAEGSSIQNSDDHCLPISAHSAEGLIRIASEYLAFLKRPDCEFRTLARAAALDRDKGLFRMAVTGSTALEVAGKLEVRLSSLSAGNFAPKVNVDVRPATAFVFSGQGSLWMGVLNGLVSGFREAESAFARCEAVVKTEGGWSLRAAAEDRQSLEDTAKAQPLLFAMQMALVAVLKQWGVLPEVAVGHSAGEVAAAVTAGVLTLEEGMRLALKRGRHMAASRYPDGQAGRMLSAAVNAQEAQSLLDPSAEAGSSPIEIAAFNAPRSTVFSGPEAAIVALEKSLQAQGIATRLLDIQYAFHSAAMDPGAEAFERELWSWTPSPQSVSKRATQLISTVTGKAWSASDGDARYWARGIRDPVQFHPAINQLLLAECWSVVEIGPHPVLLQAIEACAAECQSVITSLALMRRGQSPRATLMAAAGQLYETGLDLNWDHIYPGPRPHVALPAYPWNRQRYWLANRPTTSTASRALPPPAGDPLLGTCVSSPFVQGKLWQAALSTVTAPWLDQHRFHDQPILPFAAWIEIARRAAYEWSAEAVGLLHEFAVFQPLLLGKAPTLLQTLITDGGEIKMAALIDGKWQPCASGFVAGERVNPQTRNIELSRWIGQSNGSVRPQSLYQQLCKNGLSYGPAFQLCQNISVGDGFALGTIGSKSQSDHDVEIAGGRAASGLLLSPTFLDACLQVLQAIQPVSDREQRFLPASLQSYRVFSEATEVLVLAELRSKPGAEMEVDVSICDHSGNLVAEILGLRVRATDREAADFKASAAPMWSMAWNPLPENASSQPVKNNHRGWWLPSLDGEPDPMRLALSIRGAFRSLGIPLLERSINDFSTASSSIPTSGQTSIVLAGSRDQVTSGLLKLVARWQTEPDTREQEEFMRQLCVVTRGALAVVPGESADPDQSSLWGLLRSFRAEFPAIAVQLFDLPGHRAGPFDVADSRLVNPIALSEARLIVAHCVGCSDQPAQTSGEFALRGGRLLENQLQALSVGPTRERHKELVIAQPGLLDSLREQDVQTAAPAEDEIQVAVQAHGLNFRDVLTAVGTYAGASAPFGAECAGVIVRAGSRSGLSVGSRVLAFAPRSMRSVVNVRAQYAAIKPESMSFAEAATIPVSFLTAYFGFSRLAQLQAGQTVLIHSAAGGLGQAAIQLARLFNAEIIATAGTEEKRNHLRGQGITHVFDSRSVLFAEQVIDATSGRGVDVVLNALSGDRIAAGFAVLCSGGVFLEVGKRGIWTTAQAAETRPDVRYQAFDLGQIAERDPQLIASMFAELMHQFAAGQLTPISHANFAIRDAREAFRQMSSGKHLGKLILLQAPRAIDSSESWQTALTTGTVLITGGTGALGLKTARWLIEQGARSLLLVSRRNAPAAVQAEIQQLQRNGAWIILEQADVVVRHELEAVIARLRLNGKAPLKVVIHAAGEVDDRLLSSHTEESLLRGMRTKVEGARTLAQVTDSEDLFVSIYFSSLASVLGSASQSSYAAANAYLDGLAAERTARGLSTLSVNWGAWSGGGMVERLSESSLARIARQGMRPMAAEAALRALATAIASKRSQVVIADVDWSAFRNQTGLGAATDRFYASFLPSIDPDRRSHSAVQVSNPVGGVMQSIRSAPAGERLPRMETLVRAAARSVLGLSEGRPIPAGLPLQELGLDSLLALELRNVLAQSLALPLSATLLFDYPSVGELAKHLLQVLASEEPLNPGQVSSIADPGALAHFRLEAELSALTDAEAEELLLAELDQKGAPLSA